MILEIKDNKIYFFPYRIGLILAEIEDTKNEDDEFGDIFPYRIGLILAP